MPTDPSYWGLAIAAMALASVAKAWFSLRSTQVREQARTDRFSKAIEGSSPRQRPDIIRALGRSDEEFLDDVGWAGAAQQRAGGDGGADLLPPG